MKGNPAQNPKEEMQKVLELTTEANKGGAL